MIRSYLNTAFRTLRRNWNYTVINVVGLTFGLACCLLLFLAIRYELSYDRHNAHADRTYRLVQNWQNAQGVGRNPGIPLPTLAALRTDFPDMKSNVTMIHEIADVVVRANTPGQNKFEEPGGVVAFAEPEYFKLFDYDWRKGGAETSLLNPNTVVLTERMAQKYFGTTNALGKTLRVNNQMDFTVTGVVGQQPATSSVPFEMLLSFASLKNYGAFVRWDDWQSTYTGLQLYLLLPQDQRADAFERRMVSFVKKHHDAEAARQLSYELQPLTAIHTDTETSNYADRSVSPKLIGSMALIGLFILVTACVNFVNLATAQAIRRAKEVGVRKALGSSRGQLVRQFLGETGLLTVLAIGLSLAVAVLALPYVTELLNVKLAASALFSPEVMGFLAALAALTTMLAGFYPALVLSGYQPVLALKGKIRSVGQGQLTLRRSLIVVQFAISQVLVIGTLVAFAQMRYFRTADLGYVKEAVLTVPVPDNKPGQLERLRSQLAGLAGVESMAYGISVPSSEGNWTSSFRFGNSDKDSDYGAVMRPADTAYVRTYGLQLLAGRLYLPADTMREFVVNETFAKRLGFDDPAKIIGKTMAVGRPGSPAKPIVGVVKDFNTYSLRRKTGPSVLTTFREAYNTLGIRFSPRIGGTEGVSRLVSQVQQAWTATFPDFVFKYEFLDDRLADFYKNEERFYALFRLLAGIALFIGCLGLYGVVAFMAESRTKEVGIRKVLGATTAHIFGLFSADFLKLVGIALLIASPIGWYFMNEWLKGFEYKIAIGWWVFALAGLLAVVVALVTVSFQSIRAAMMNPVKSLRTE